MQITEMENLEQITAGDLTWSDLECMNNVMSKLYDDHQDIAQKYDQLANNKLLDTDIKSDNYLTVKTDRIFKIQSFVPMQTAIQHLQSECSEIASEHNLGNVEILKDITLDNHSHFLDNEHDKTITLDDSFINVQKSMITFPHRNFFKHSELTDQNIHLQQINEKLTDKIDYLLQLLMAHVLDSSTFQETIPKIKNGD